MKRSNISTIVILAIIGMFLALGCGRLGSLVPKQNASNTSSSETSDASNTANKETTQTTPISGTPLYDREHYSDRADEIAKVKTRTKLDADHTLDGKVAIVIKPYDFSTEYALELFTSATSDYLDTFALDRYGITKDQVAQTVEDLDTLVRVTCDTKKLGTYTLSNGRSIPAKGLDCTVEMIDYRSGTIFAKKTFHHGKLDDFVTISPDSDDYTNFEALTGAEEYIKSFPRA